MPEGDTLHRIAARLRPALVDRPLLRFEAPRLAGPQPRPPVVVTAVDAVGKHLVIRFADGWLLRTHLRMTGSWHLYEDGQPWRKPAHLARAVVAVPGWEAVCFSAPVVVLERERPGSSLGAPVTLGHLGPDLCTADADLDEVVRRMGQLADPTATIAEVLLDQRVAAGIGNVYKSEVLWACRVHPFTPLADIDDRTRRRLVERAHRLLLANLGPGPRTTLAGRPGSLAVYGRRGRPCPACGTPVQVRRHGEQARSTAWCPRCQPPG